ncbi:MAG TPA: hypothetical protein VMM80_11225 [Bacteroidota bacterium]|nr:hypothetical protein [Bacteroidota bacterium]
MGFGDNAPRPDFTTAVQTIHMWVLRADAAILSGVPPWDSLLAGVPPESLVVNHELALVNYYRSKSLALWIYLDPGNGLNRSGEADGLVRNGRSITETAIQKIYRRYAVVSDSILHPEHMGLALETNLIRGLSSASLYQAIRQVANDAAADVQARDPYVKLSVSVQVDWAWGRFGGPYQGVETDFADFPFIQELGLSSYPYFAHFAHPEDIPDNYYSRLLAGRMIPAMVTEGGWTSSTLDTIISSPELQRRYIVRQARLLDALRAIAVFQLTFTDIDLSAYPQQDQAPLLPFAFLGLVDVNLAPRPSLGAWDSLFALPRSP